MYSVLLVDDEKVIREGVCELLSMSDMDLELATAASAVEAIAILERRKIDIAVLDVCMPQMSGMELYDILRERWPHCRLIFLTGHLEFEYVYKVHQHARYVLKAEDDRKLVEAVRESIKEIESDLMLTQMTRDRSRQLHKSRFFERALLLGELAEGSDDRASVVGELLESAEGALDTESPVFSVLLRSFALDGMEYARRSEIIENTCLLIEKSFLDRFKGMYLGYRRAFHFILLQPRKEIGREKALALLTDCCELYQKAVAVNLSIRAAVYIRETPVPIARALEDFTVVRDCMLRMEPDEIKIGEPFPQNRTANGLSDDVKRELSRRLATLESRFDNMDRAGIMEILEEISQKLNGVADMRDLFAVEIYCIFYARLLSYVQRIGLEGAVASRFANDLSAYANWTEALSALKRTAGYVFEQVDISIESRNEDVAKNVKSYIRHHLDGDTSLYALAEHVHLCPEYLLRIFKKQEGVTILQYTNDLKLARAKQLLAETDMQIKEIAAELGFTGVGYFGRFFKSKTGDTPNLYREKRTR